jgi:hypothetical protein
MMVSWTPFLACFLPRERYAIVVTCLNEVQGRNQVQFRCNGRNRCRGRTGCGREVGCEEKTTGRLCASRRGTCLNVRYGCVMVKGASVAAMWVDTSRLFQSLGRGRCVRGRESVCCCKWVREMVESEQGRVGAGDGGGW